MGTDELIDDVNEIKRESVNATIKELDSLSFGEIANSDAYEKPLEYIDGYIESMVHVLDIMDDGIPIDEMGFTQEDIDNAIALSNEIISHLDQLD